MKQQDLNSTAHSLNLELVRAIRQTHNNSRYKKKSTFLAYEHLYMIINAVMHINTSKHID